MQKFKQTHWRRFFFALLAWWFVFIKDHLDRATTVIGPFTDKNQCERIKKEILMKNQGRVTECWQHLENLRDLGSIG